MRTAGRTTAVSEARPPADRGRAVGANPGAGPAGVEAAGWTTAVDVADRAAAMEAAGRSSAMKSAAWATTMAAAWPAAVNRAARSAAAGTSAMMVAGLGERRGSSQRRSRQSHGQ